MNLWCLENRIFDIGVLGLESFAFLYHDIGYFEFESNSSYHKNNKQVNQIG